MKTKACLSAIFRLAIVCIVLFTPDLSLKALLVFSWIISSLWAIEPLWRRWQREEQGPPRAVPPQGDVKPVHKAAAWMLAVAMFVAPFNVQSQDSPPDRNDQELSMVEGFMAFVIVVLTGYGYYRYYVKAKTQTDKIGKKKEKQIEATNPWPDDPSPQTNTVASKVSGIQQPTEYGAWYLEGVPVAEDLWENDGPLPVIEWVTPERGESVKPRFYFPANPIELGEYLGQHGLNESTNTNYSINGSPTSNAPPIFSYTNLVLTFAIPGTVNRTSILQRSPDLSRWETIFTAVAPPRMLNNFADGTAPDLNRQFYRVLVAP